VATLLENIRVDYELNKPLYDEMQDYYDGKSYALKNYTECELRSNRKINCNYTQKFVNEEASYVIGNPVTYTSNTNNVQEIKDINSAFKSWSLKHNKELVKQSLIFNQAYELYFTDKRGDFASIICTPQDSYALLDDNGYIEVFVRFYHKKFDTTEYADVFTDENITHYTVLGGLFEQIGVPEQNIFSRIPVSIVNIGTVYESLFCNIKSLQDAYSIILSDICNEISDNRNAYLILRACDLIDEDITKMQEMGILQLPNDKAGAEYLIKNLNDSFIQNTLKTLQENIYMLANHINYNQSLSSNTSSLALKNQLIGLINKCTNNIQAIQDCFKTRIEFLFEYLAKTKGTSYDWKDIECLITPNIPSDDMLIAQILSQYPEFSVKTGLSQFSFIKDVDNEMKQKEIEAKALSIGADLLNNSNNNTIPVNGGAA